MELKLILRKGTILLAMLRESERTAGDDDGVAWRFHKSYF